MRGWYIAYYYSFNQGLGPVQAAKWDKELDQEVHALGFVNHSGAWVIQPIPMQLHWWMNYPETSAEVFGPTGLATLENKDGMCGAIDKTGKTVIPFRYEGLGMVDDGLIFFREDGKYGYGHVEYLPPLPERDELDAWAYDEVVAAIENGLVPNEPQDLYRSDITRGEFCGLVMQAVTEALGVSTEELVQQRTGKALSAWVGEYPFRDTADADIIAASALDIVNGRGEAFDPNGSYSREQSFMTVYRLFQWAVGQ